MISVLIILLECIAAFPLISAHTMSYNKSVDLQNQTSHTSYTVNSTFCEKSNHSTILDSETVSSKEAYKSDSWTSHAEITQSETLEITSSMTSMDLSSTSSSISFMSVTATYLPIYA